jgi:hypothetical protein
MGAAIQAYAEETQFNMYMTYLLKPQDFEDIWLHNCDYDNGCESDEDSDYDQESGSDEHSEDDQASESDEDSEND